MLAAIRMAIPEEVLSPKPEGRSPCSTGIWSRPRRPCRRSCGLASRVPGSHAERDVANGVFVLTTGARATRPARAPSGTTAGDFHDRLCGVPRRGHGGRDDALPRHPRRRGASLLGQGRETAEAQGKLEHIAERGLREALERFGDEAVAEAADLIASGSADLSEAMEACARVEVAMALGQSVGTAPLDGATIVAQGTVTGQESGPGVFRRAVASAVAGAMSSPSIDLEAVAEAVDGPTAPSPRPAMSSRTSTTSPPSPPRRRNACPRRRRASPARSARAARSPSTPH